MSLLLCQVQWWACIEMEIILKKCPAVCANLTNCEPLPFKRNRTMCMPQMSFILPCLWKKLLQDARAVVIDLTTSFDSIHIITLAIFLSTFFPRSVLMHRCTCGRIWFWSQFLHVLVRVRKTSADYCACAIPTLSPHCFFYNLLTVGGVMFI